MEPASFLSTLARANDRKIVLLVLDGVGDIRSETQPRTALELARTPHLDALAAKGALGRLTPVLPGVTPGSGPGHLSLFGYDPQDPAAVIGRGALEALGLGIELGKGDVAARCNFATLDDDGLLVDRRAGRIPTSECVRLTDALRARIESLDTDLDVEVHAGEAYRFVLLFRGEGLDACIEDTDPQLLGVAPLPLTASDPAAADAVRQIAPIVKQLLEVLTDEPRANGFLMRGFATVPDLPSFQDLYALRPGAFAGYPLYRGVAGACGMEVYDCPKDFRGTVATVARHWDDHDFFFLHVKQTDMAGEDGNLAFKVEVLEEVDRHFAELLALEPDVVAVTGDHSTPAPMKAHSWHPIPLLLWGANCFADESASFDELEARRGGIGDLRSKELMGLLLGNAGKLEKFGA